MALPSHSTVSDKLKHGIDKLKAIYHRPRPPSIGPSIVSGTRSIANSYLAPGLSDHPVAPRATTEAPASRGLDVYLSDSDSSKYAQQAERNVGAMAKSGVRMLLDVLHDCSSSLFPIKSAIGLVAKFLEATGAQVKARDEFRKLTEDLDQLFRDLAGYMQGPAPLTLTPIIQYIAGELQEAADSAIKKGSRTSIERLAQAVQDIDEIIVCYRRIQTLLDRLILNFNMNIWKTVDEHATDARLSKLPNVPSAKFQSTGSGTVRRSACTPGTRVELLQQIQTWADNLESEKVYWLNGMAGTGKTAIAYSLCDYLKSLYQLGASFFCSRQLPSCRDVTRIIPSLAYQLSLFSQPFRHALDGMLQRDKDLHNQPVQEQFESLVVAPLKQVAHTFPECVTIVIDALDECEDRDGVDRILGALLAHATEIPVKFFVTSRPDAKIIDQMSSTKADGVRSELHLHDLERSIVQQDIRTYLSCALELAKIPYTKLDRLVEQSGVLFVYAATVVRYIEYDNFSRSAQRLEQVLGESFSDSAAGREGIDTLYTTILRAAFHDNNLTSPEKSEMAMVLNTVVCARKPLSVSAIAEMTELDESRSVRPALRPLFSVLNMSSSTGLVTTLHESFPDYIFDERRANRFYCDPRKHNAQMAKWTFRLLEKIHKPFNICNLESSYWYDDSVPDLPDRVNNSISKALYYASRYWYAHWELSGYSSELIRDLVNLLSTRLLLWAEIMNLKKCLGEGVEVLYRTVLRLDQESCSDDSRNLALDAYNFIAMVFSSPISRSTPHIYVSALRFWPESRPVSRCYLPRLSGLVGATGTAMHRRLNVLTPITIHARDSAYAVAYSPDGQHIAVSSWNYIQIWDIRTGREVGQPLVGHEGDVTSVAYSKDCLYLVSGSHDRAVCVWDLRSMRLKKRLLGGHTDVVSSVAYSPDGAYIVSGSFDRTLQIWDSRTYQMCGSPIYIPDGVVISVSYSPGGAHILATSSEGGGYIWNLSTREIITHISRDSGTAFTSSSYSPNGDHIITGCRDYSICIWSAHTGQLIGEPLVGHSDIVTSAIYVTNGTQIVSSAFDSTIRIWDASTGKQIGEPLEGHTQPINALAVSPSGTHIASCSQDQTIRIWDIRANRNTQQVYMDGHRNAVRAVAYSRDGTRIVSGSDDDTICVWDAYTGQMKTKAQSENRSAIVIACSPGGEHALSITAGNSIYVWDLKSMEIERKLLGAQDDWIVSAAYSPDGSMIVSGSDRGVIHLWDANTGHTAGAPLRGHTGPVRAISYSPNSAYIVSGSEDCSIRIWDANTRRTVQRPLTGHEKLISAITISADGLNVISGSYDTTVRVWNIKTGELIHRLQVDHTGSVHSIVCSPNGAHIIAGTFEGIICIWSAHTGGLEQILKGHVDRVNSVSCSPNGQEIVSGSMDGTIRVWLPETFRPDNTRAFIHESGSSKASKCSDIGSQAWKMDKDGWIVSSAFELILWVPRDLRQALLRPECPIVISRFGALSLELDEANIGLHWRKCYLPCSETSCR